MRGGKGVGIEVAMSVAREVVGKLEAKRREEPQRDSGTAGGDGDVAHPVVAGNAIEAFELEVPGEGRQRRRAIRRQASGPGDAPGEVAGNGEGVADAGDQELVRIPGLESDASRLGGEGDDFMRKPVPAVVQENAGERAGAAQHAVEGDAVDETRPRGAGEAEADEVALERDVEGRGCRWLRLCADRRHRPPGCRGLRDFVMVEGPGAVDRKERTKSRRRDV